MKLTPKKAIHKHCRECMGGSMDECTSPLCGLYPFNPSAPKIRTVWHTVRKDGFGAEKNVKLTPLRAIRHQCTECYGFDKFRHQIQTCPSKKCPLWSFRFGVLPTTAQKRGQHI